MISSKSQTRCVERQTRSGDIPVAVALKGPEFRQGTSQSPASCRASVCLLRRQCDTNVAPPCVPPEPLGVWSLELGIWSVLLLFLVILGFPPSAACAAEPAAPLTLASALVEVRENNPDIRIAEKRMREAEAMVRQADSALWPKFSVQSVYSRTDNSIGVFGAVLNQRSFAPTLNFNDVPDADNLLLRGAIVAPLYTGGAIRSARQAAREGSAAALHTARAVADRMSLETTRLFFVIAQADGFVRAAEAAVHSFEENIAIARKRLDSGKALKTDVLDLEVRLAQAEADRVAARAGSGIARRALANLLGREAGSVEVVEPGDLLTVAGDAEGGERAELLAVSRQKAAAESGVHQARAGRYPKFSAFVNGDHNRGWKLNGSSESYTAGVMASWDLWDGHLTRGKLEEAKARVDAVSEQERKLRLQIDFEIQQARLNATAADGRLRAANKAVTLAEESVGLTRVRFEQGLALSTQLIDAETALTGARVRQTQARADRNIATAALRHALGLPQIEETKEK